MTPIANCKVEFAFQCPKQWGKLKLTGNPTIRFCEVCSRNVHLCLAWEDVHHHASAGNCIAIPPRESERHGLIGEVITAYRSSSPSSL